MKKLLVLIVAVFALTANAQEGGKDFYSAEFKWTIKVPAGFVKSLDEGDVEPGEVIMAVDKDEVSYMEATQQPYDVNEDGDYGELQELVGDMMKENLESQFSETNEIVMTSAKEKIGGYDFYRFNYTITDTSDDSVLYLHMFSAFISNKDFCMSISYVDKADGETMLKAWKASTF
ncbi:MAG: hypothetical protein V4581_00230, partial [Bacteroidota bacterium]